MLVIIENFQNFIINFIINSIIEFIINPFDFKGNFTTISCYLNSGCCKEDIINNFTVKMGYNFEDLLNCPFYLIF